MDRAELLAAYGDFSGFKALGYTDAQISLMQSAYQAQQKEQQKQKSSSGPRTGGGTPSAYQDYEGLFRAAYDAGDNAKSFIANNYGNYGFDRSTGLYDEFMEAAETPIKSGLEMNTDDFRATMQSITSQLAAGKAGAAEANINRVWVSFRRTKGTAASSAG